MHDDRIRHAGRAPEETVDVLIVGGGPVGLTLALELEWHNVSVVLCDKRPKPSFLPKMERCNSRTMENFRKLGLADRMRDHGYPVDLPMDVFICVENLVRKPLVQHEYPSVEQLRRASRRENSGFWPAEPYQLISQYTLEPLLVSTLRERAKVDVQFGSEVTGFTADDDGVDVVVTDIESGQERVLRARYLVGCDGASSFVRSQLGIGLAGDSMLQMWQALFHCPDLFDRIPIGKGRHYHIADNQQTFLIVQDDTRHFSLHATVETAEEMNSLFEKVAGLPIEYETLFAGKWTQRLMLADAYRKGRVFLAGDAVHLVIPTGGLGMNTGVGDAIDLGWKLAGDLHGWGGAGLLDSYEAERRPIGHRNLNASRRAAKGRQHWRAQWRPEIVENTPEGEKARRDLAAVADVEQRWSNALDGIELGYRYVGSPIIEGTEVDGPDPDSFTYTPTMLPGARLPHVWLEDGSAVQDGVKPAFTVLRLSRNSDVAPLVDALARAGAPVTVIDLAESENARRVYGEETVLLRPDLHIAYRGNIGDIDASQLARRATGHR